MAATTDAQICNMALLRIGVTRTIDSLDSPTEEGRACKAVFDWCRDAVLASFDWPFASRWEQLAEPVGDPIQGWAHTYALPTGCLVAREIWCGLRNPRTDQRTPFEVAGGLVGTDAEAPVALRYTARVTHFYPPGFKEALAWRLAIDLTLALRKDGSLYGQAKQEYEIALSRAKVEAVNEGVPDRPPPSLIEALHNTLRERDWTCRS